MRFFVAFLAVVGLSAVKGEIDCTLEPATGMCLAYFPSFFFNISSGECEEFVYGGCGGNTNRFPSKRECEVVCQTSATVDCHAAPEVGLCQAIIPRFYYDAESRECKQFTYGGCGGNTNNFHTHEECERRCSVETPEVKLHDCKSKAETGLCKGFFPRFFFNTETGRCERFVYGGCGGNTNNYNTADECRAVCGGVEEKEVDCNAALEVGPCKASMPRFYYDAHSQECKLFTYGGCGGNTNNFPDEFECERRCSKSVPEAKEEPEVHPDCSSPADTGMCRGNFPGFFYNTVNGQCEEFVYGGCGGNANNYPSKEECEATCGPRQTPVDCHSEPEAGNCRGSFPMYFFNRHTGTCESFIYGGCGGNDNRFESEKECEDSCLM